MTKAPKLYALHSVEELLADTGIRASLRLMLAARGIAGYLVGIITDDRRFWHDQVTRVKADLTALEGCRSVELEGAAREAWRQALRPLTDEQILNSEPLDFEACIAAATKARPREVLGEAVAHPVARKPPLTAR